MRKLFVGVALAALVGSAGAIQAPDITPLEFTVSFDGNYPDCCEVDTGLVAVYSSHAGEFGYGFAEFNLLGTSISTVPLYLTFTLAAIDTNPSPDLANYSNSSIEIDAYDGNNKADRTDVKIGSIGNVGSFDFLSQPVGSRVTLDVTNVFNSAVASNAAALGIRIKGAGFAFRDYTIVVSETYSDFRLTNAIPAVPEPNAAWLLLCGLSLLVMRRQRE